ncbi:MAG: hypothetical protein HKN87_14735 [Saprospiraceae bacterium]|nr:hypothetical protein [Saprospiraceae bacterium]
MKRFCLLICNLAVIYCSVFSQQVQRWQIPITHSDHELDHALVGGLNAPQFSTIDLNRDSLVDLFIFDRSGHKVLTFIRNDVGSIDALSYAPSYQTSFPEMREWALIRDFNRDSIPDIFTFATNGIPGIDVYRGISAETGYGFEKVFFDNPLQVLGYPTSSGAIANIYVSTIDIPDIADLDGDGDLDILSFQSDGTKIHYYRNMQEERGLDPDSLIYVLQDKCWGKVVESFNTNDVIISSDSTTCPTVVMTKRAHSGSTIASFDPDKDGLQDILLGDFTYETLLFLQNKGSKENAFIVDQEQMYPSYDRPVSIPFFPAAYMGDYDGDGFKDFIASPNQVDARQNVAVSWYYEAIDDGSFIRYRFLDSAFLVSEMLDFGLDAAPMFIDYNADGMKDLVVASRFHADFDPDHPSQLFLYLNTGSKSAPSFTLIDSNWLDMPGNIDEADMLYPTCADMDGDGDDDLIIGNKRGKLTYVENVGIADGPFEIGSIVHPWFDIDVGFSSAPAVADVDGNGILDLLIGEERGNINLFRNIGTVNNPQFDIDGSSVTNDEDFGQIDARQNLAVFGLASPTTFVSNDSLFLLVGSAIGNFLTYHLAGNYENGSTLSPLEHAIGSIAEGERSKMAIADLDENGYFDVMVGNGRGGLGLFRSNFRSEAIVPIASYQDLELDAAVYPIPTADQLNVQIDLSGTRHIRVLSTSGATLAEWTGEERMKTFDVNGFANGVYYIWAKLGRQTCLRSWIKAE